MIPAYVQRIYKQINRSRYDLMARDKVHIKRCQDKKDVVTIDSD
jgi:hypothetical protein